MGPLSSCTSRTRVFPNDVLIDPGLGIRTTTRRATPRVHPWSLLLREGQVQSRVGRLLTFNPVTKPSHQIPYQSVIDLFYNGLH